MGRSVRMFAIIQLLRTARALHRAKHCQQFGGDQRTVYLDIAVLQAPRVLIEGAVGVGYVMRAGFDLPPINFDVEEAEAITVDLAMITLTGDKGLKRAAQKLADATPLSNMLFASSWGTPEPPSIDLSDVRKAIREEQKINITYKNSEEVESARTILPVAIAYH